jgi:hypothetical protein
MSCVLPFSFFFHLHPATRFQACGTNTKVSKQWAIAIYGIAQVMEHKSTMEG